MQDILTCAMGLDVHRDIIVACLVKGAVDAEPEAETRTFSTLIPEMQKLRDWVIGSLFTRCWNPVLTARSAFLL